MRSAVAFALLACLLGSAAADRQLHAKLFHKHHKPPAVSGAPVSGAPAMAAGIAGAGVAPGGILGSLLSAAGMVGAGATAGAGAMEGAAAGAMTPQSVPAECLSVTEVAQKAGNFSILLAAAQVGAGASLSVVSCC